MRWHRRAIPVEIEDGNIVRMTRQLGERVLQQEWSDGTWLDVPTDPPTS